MPRSTTDELPRIKMRVEGDYWNAYWADGDSLVLLANIRMSLVFEDPVAKVKFQELIQHCMTKAIGAAGLQIASWGTQPAPPDEFNPGGH